MFVSIPGRRHQFAPSITSSVGASPHPQTRPSGCGKPCRNQARRLIAPTPPRSRLEAVGLTDLCAAGTRNCVRVSRRSARSRASFRSSIPPLVWPPCTAFRSSSAAICGATPKPRSAGSTRRSRPGCVTRRDGDDEARPHDHSRAARGARAGRRAQCRGAPGHALRIQALLLAHLRKEESSTCPSWRTSTTSRSWAPSRMRWPVTKRAALRLEPSSRSTSIGRSFPSAVPSLPASSSCSLRGPRALEPQHPAVAHPVRRRRDPARRRPDERSRWSIRTTGSSSSAVAPSSTTSAWQSASTATRTRSPAPGSRRS